MANYRAAARRAARRYGLDPNVFVRQIGAESGFDPNVTSPAGAIGIAQIMPATARGWGVNPRNPVASLDAAARHMAGYVRQYGSYGDALRAYNAGPGNVQRSHGFAETNAYVNRVLRGRDPGPLGKANGGGGATSLQLAAPNAVNVTELLSTLGGAAAQPRPAITPPAAPSFSAAPVAPKGYQPVESNAAAPVSKDYAGAISALAQATRQLPRPQIKTVGGGGGGGGGTGGGGQAGVKAKGTANFEGHTVAAWIAPALAYARKHGWKGEVNSGFRSFAEQQRIFNSGVRPAARPGTSNHEGAEFPRGAVDVSQAQQLSDILRRSPWRKRLQWAGSKDPVHFSHPHGGSY